MYRELQSPTRPDVTYQTEDASRSWEEAMPLLLQHYNEIARYKDIPLDPDREAYEAIERAGQLRIYSARAAGTLIGYALYMVRHSLHYRSSIHAHQDILFVTKPYRIGRIGAELIGFADQCLKEEGVQLVSQHVKDYADFGALLKQLGYEKIEATWMKRLDV